MNYLSGSTGVFPYFVASGQVIPKTNSSRMSTGRIVGYREQIWPDFPRTACVGGFCTVLFEGVNMLAAEYLLSEFRGRVGVIMADFPGRDLIDAVVAHNFPGTAEATGAKSSALLLL